MTRPTPDKLKLLQELLKAKGVPARESTGIPRRSADSATPLSFGQQRMWFLQQLDPGSSEYNDTLTVRLVGARLHPELLQRAIAVVVQRHEVLRTAFVAQGGEPQQQVRASLEVPLVVEDLGALAPDERERRRAACWLADVRRAFVLDRPPLLRTTLLRLCDDEWEFGLTMHHIVSDGVAYAIFFAEVGTAYAALATGTEPTLPELPIQFGDYAAWERRSIDEDVIQRKLPFWKRYLADAVPLALPYDRAPSGARRHNGAFLRFAWPPALFDQMVEFCRRERVTSNWVLLAAYFALWHRYSGQSDALIGTPSSVRNRTELEPLIGFFVQTLIVRLDLGGNPTFRELIRRAQKTALEVAVHEDVPFDRIFQAVRPGQTAAAAPLIQAWIAPMKNLLTPLQVEGAQASYEIVDPHNARFDVALILDETATGCTGYWEYDVDLFDAATIARIDRQWNALLQQVLRLPDTTLGLLRETLRGDDEPARAPRDRRVLDLKKVKRPPT